MKTFSKSVLNAFAIVVILLIGIIHTNSSVSADAINELLGTKTEKVVEEPATKIITTDNTNISDKKKYVNVWVRFLLN